MDDSPLALRSIKAMIDNEFDVVVAVSRIKMGDWAYIKNEISRIKKASKHKIVKIIAETASLNRTELSKLCAICAKYKINYVQTSTGFAKSLITFAYASS